MKPVDNHLLVIDPQNDFCDLPETYLARVAGARPAAPSLAVPGAHADMLRVAEIIDRGAVGLRHITVTLDSHQRFDIGHPTFWETGEGGAVAPFTQITAADVHAGRFRPRRPEASSRVIRYLEALESNGRFIHMIWPVHCEIGTWGQNIHDDVRLAYNRWEEKRAAIATKVMKGTNPWTEHYSAIQAEVPDPTDGATQSNGALLADLRQADQIFIVGEAGSHCVRATTEHIVAAFTGAGDDLRKLVLVTDCMSPVAGFEATQAGFLADMKERGLRTATARDVIAELQTNATS